MAVDFVLDPYDHMLKQRLTLEAFNKVNILRILYQIRACHELNSP